MKLKYIAFLGLGLSAVNLSAQNPAQPKAQPYVRDSFPAVSGPPTAPSKEDLSYAVGVNLGTSLKANHADIDPDIIMSALKDVLAGNSTRLSVKDARDVMNRWGRAEQFKQRAAAEALQKSAGDFRANFSKEPGVITLTNGLAYKIVQEGTGDLAKPSDTVTMKYTGALIDGKTFDHSDSFTTPVVGRTIAGWSEIMQLMKKGSKFHVVIPPELAYGPSGMPPLIPAMATLVFDMELISIQPAAPAPAPTLSLAPAKPVQIGAQPGATTTQSIGQVVSGQIIKVPSQDEIKKGAKIEVIDANTLTNKNGASK